MLYNVSEHKEVCKKMNKKLLQSVREYKKQSIITPLLVTLEVLMEVLIPLEMAKIIDIGIAEGNLGYIIQRGLILVIMAMMSLFSVYRPETLQQLPEPDMPKTCGTIFIIKYRIFPLKISTIFPRPVL